MQASKSQVYLNSYRERSQTSTTKLLTEEQASCLADYFVVNRWHRSYCFSCIAEFLSHAEIKEPVLLLTTLLLSFRVLGKVNDNDDDNVDNRPDGYALRSQVFVFVFVFVLVKFGLCQSFTRYTL